MNYQLIFHDLNGTGETFKPHTPDVPPSSLSFVEEDPRIVECSRFLFYHLKTTTGEGAAMKYLVMAGHV